MIRKWLSFALLALAFLPCLALARGLQSSAASPIAQEQTPAAPQPAHRASTRPIEEQEKVTAYTLPPDLYRNAKALGRIHFLTNLVNFVYGLLAFWLALELHLAPKFRDWAQSLTSNRFVQAFLFTTPLIVAVSVLDSPTAIYEHIVSRKYGSSVEGWGALAWDWTKGIFLFIVIGSFLVWILYGVIRRSRATGGSISG